MRMRENDRVELVIDAPWFEKFPWSRQLLDPHLGQRAGAPAFAVTGTLGELGHPAGLFARTDGSWDGTGRRHEGLEIFVPWAYVIAMFEIRSDEEAAARRVGFVG